jgi:anthranilate phosphoribosyltransferase
MTDMLSDITPFIRKISEHNNLTAEEAQKAFDIAIQEDTEGYYFLALFLALHTKGETSDELLGFCKSNERFTPKIYPNINLANITDVSGTGGDRIKTFNISTAAAIIVASSGINIAKQCFYAVTGFTGGADLLQSLGYDITGINTPDKVKTILEKNGLVFYSCSFLAREQFKNRTNFFQEIMKKRGLTFINPFHLAGYAYSPIKMERRTYGMFTDKYLNILAEVFQKLGYKRGLVFYGLDGLDEISNVGPTKIVEYTAKRMKAYIISPRDLGLKKAGYDDIKAISRERNIIDFLRVLYGKDRGSRRDIVLANAAASLYVMDKVKDLAEGVKAAGKIIDEGLAFKKLEQLIKAFGDEKQLGGWKKKAGLTSR